MNKRVRHVYVIPRHKQGLQKIKAYFFIFKSLLNEHYDLLAQFSIDWRGALLARLLNAKITVSRANNRRGFFWHKSFDFLAPALDQKRPMAEQDVDIIRAVNLYKKSSAPPYQLVIDRLAKAKIFDFLKKNKIGSKKKLIIIHPSSRWRFKEISFTIWAKIIDELSSHDLDIVIAGSNEDLEKNKAIFNLCKFKPKLTTNFSLSETAALYKSADLLITIDSMSTHLASAVGAPVITIFGPTNKRVWGPWKALSQVISMSVEDYEKISSRLFQKDSSESAKIGEWLKHSLLKLLKDKKFNILK